METESTVLGRWKGGWKVVRPHHWRSVFRTEGWLEAYAAPGMGCGVWEDCPFPFDSLDQRVLALLPVLT